MFPVSMRAGLSLLTTLALGIASAATPAEAGCTPIPSLPHAIQAPGSYCLHKDLTMPGGASVGAWAITINADDVVLDLEGHSLIGPGGPANGVYGVLAFNHSNITVRNGRVIGFFIGIRLIPGPSNTNTGDLVEGLLVEGSGGVGISVEADASVVRSNIVTNTGGTTVGPSSQGLGILISGEGVRVLNNDVISVTSVGSGDAIGIKLFNTATDGLVVNNRITSAPVGIAIFGTGKYRDNLTIGVGTPYLGGTDAGNNN